MERPGNIGDHSTEHLTDHLKTKRHKEPTKNKMTYLDMCNCRTNVWKLAQEASLASNTTKIDCNRFVINSFVHIMHSMITKNWAYTHNLCHVVDLVAHCGGKKISTRLIMAPKNVTYVSPEYIIKYINIMAEFIKKPVHSIMQGHKSTFCSDETQDITSVEQLALYATFIMNEEVKEHFTGLIPISKVVETHMPAVNLCQPWKMFLKI